MSRSQLFRRFHGAATIFWIVMVIPTILYWKESVTYLVFLSIYTVILDHVGAWETLKLARSQEKSQEKDQT